MDDYVRIGRQFGTFLRQAERFYSCLKVEPDGLDLERASYLLLSRLATGGPDRLSVLADDLRLDLSTVSRQVTALEDAGLARRTPDKADRRATVVEVTDQGEKVFARNRERWHAAMRELLSDWTDDERQTFADLFTRLNDSIARRAGASLCPSADANTNGEHQRRGTG